MASRQRPLRRPLLRLSHGAVGGAPYPVTTPAPELGLQYSNEHARNANPRRANPRGRPADMPYTGRPPAVAESQTPASTPVPAPVAPSDQRFQAGLDNVDLAAVPFADKPLAKTPLASTARQRRLPACRDPIRCSGPQPCRSPRRRPRKLRRAIATTRSMYLRQPASKVSRWFLAFRNQGNNRLLRRVPQAERLPMLRRHCRAARRQESMSQWVWLIRGYPSSTASVRRGSRFLVAGWKARAV